MAPSIKVGDTLPKGEFGYIPWDPALEDNVRTLSVATQSLSSMRSHSSLAESVCTSFLDNVVGLIIGHSEQGEHGRVEGQEGRAVRCPRRVHRELIHTDERNRS
jgi:hypothetical protein